MVKWIFLVGKYGLFVAFRVGFEHESGEYARIHLFITNLRIWELLKEDEKFWSTEQKPERLERTQAGMIIPVYIGANKRSAEGTKDLSPFQGFRVLGIWYRGWYPRLWFFAPSGLAGPTAADNPVNLSNP